MPIKAKCKKPHYKNKGNDSQDYLKAWQSYCRL